MNPRANPPQDPTNRCQDRSQGFVLIVTMIFLMVLMVVGLTAMQNSTMGQKVAANAAVATQAREGSDWSRRVLQDVIFQHFACGGWPASGNAGIGNGGLSGACGTMTVPSTLYVRSTASVAGNCILISNGTTTGTFGIGTTSVDNTSPTVTLKAATGTYAQSGAMLYSDKMTQTPSLATSVLDFSCPDVRLVVDPSGNGTSQTTTNIYAQFLGTTMLNKNSANQASGYEGSGVKAASVSYLDVRSCSNMDPYVAGQCRSTNAATIVTGVQYQLVPQ